MKVEIRLFAYLRDYVKPGAEGGRLSIATTARDVRSLLGELGIPLSQAAIILRNGRHVDPNVELHEGDVVSIFPPIAGG